MRALKITLYVVGGIVAIMLIAIVAIALLFDANRYKAEVERIVEQQTHRHLTLAGDLKLSFFPWLAIQVGPAQLSERANFGDQPFISMQGARMSLRVWPLLQGKVEVGSVELDEPSIRLITNEQGQHNWSDLAKQDAPQPQAVEPSPSQLDLQLAGIAIRNGSLILEDRKANTRQAIQQFTLTTGAIANNQPFNLQMGLVLEQADKPSLPVQLKARVAADFKQGQHRLDQLSFTAQWRVADNAKPIDIALRSETLQVDVHQQTLNLQGLTLDVGNTHLTGNLTGKEIFDAPQWQGTLSLAPFALRETLHGFGIELPVTRAQVLKQLGFEASFAATSSSVSLKPVQLKLDNSTLKGELAIVDFASSALRFDLAIDHINFDQYLPPAEEASANTKKDSAPTPIPVEALRSLNARGTLRMAEATFSGLHFSKMQLGMNARDGELKLQPTDASLYGGEYRGDITLDVTRTPKLSIESHASSIDFAPLFKDLFDSKSIQGHGNVNIKATASGKDTAAMMRALNGTLDFQVRNGAYQGIDLLYEIRRARAVLHQDPIPERTRAEQTEFTSCQGSGVITNGVLSNKDLDIAMQLLKITGQGSADIVNDKIDYRLIANVLRIPHEGEAINPDLVDAKIPITVSGAMSDPKVRPDIEGLIKEEVKKKVDEKKEELKDKLRDKLRGLLGGE